jgi:hypothetical protein
MEDGTGANKMTVGPRRRQQQGTPNRLRFGIGDLGRPVLVPICVHRGCFSRSQRFDRTYADDRYRRISVIARGAGLEVSECPILLKKYRVAGLRLG